MGFNISPGVYTTEIDLTGVIPSVATTGGALAGVFRWGPVGERVRVESEKGLADKFGKPTNINPETFFTGASFLSYSSNLLVVRAANTTATNTSIDTATLNAVATANNIAASNAQLATSVVRNDSHFEDRAFDPGVFFVARFPGAMGNSLKVSVVDTADAYESTVNLTPNAEIDSAQTAITFTTGSSTAVINIVPSGTGTVASSNAVATAIRNSVTPGDLLKAGNSSIGTQLLRVRSVGAPSVDGANVAVTIALDSRYTLPQQSKSTSVNRLWEHYNLVSRAPKPSFSQAQSNNPTVVDELHLVVIDEDGEFTGTPGTVLEVYEGVSRSTDAKNEQGETKFFKNIINQSSRYVRVTNDLMGAGSTITAGLSPSANRTPTRFSLAGGQDADSENTIALAELAFAYDLFASADDVDISLIMQGPAKNNTGLANYLIDNIASVRKDCIVFVSPPRAAVVNAPGREVDNIRQFRNALSSTSYGFMDSGYKYTYDKYNDVYRYVPLNGDIAGIVARSEQTADAWVSPGGVNRGSVKNVYKLAWNPSQVQRDDLYKMDVNPVVALAGSSNPILYGDKTLLGRSSAFDRINVRRLFIVLEKAIARASAATLFEINDEFTRAQFVNMVEPFLREVQGRRGIYDFRVVCDETNNTAEVIDSNGFIGDIYIKPARSINTIQLNFVAVRSGAEFSEIVGQF